MKNKFLYVTTGLLTIVVIGVMFLSPQLYFAYEDWTDHNITTTEEANLNNRNRNITVARNRPHSDAAAAKISADSADTITACQHCAGAHLNENAAV